MGQRRGTRKRRGVLPAVFGELVDRDVWKRIPFTERTNHVQAGPRAVRIAGNPLRAAAGKSREGRVAKAYAPEAVLCSGRIAGLPILPCKRFGGDPFPAAV